MMSKHTEKDLKNVVRFFKHSELRDLLTFAKRNSVGRKSLLQERVNEMIDGGCTTSIVFKINEINDKKNVLKSLTKKHLTENKSKSPESSIMKTVGSTKVATDKISNPQNNDSLQECGYVKFSELPFYEQLEVVLKPVHLKSNLPFGSSSCARFNFQLSPQQTQYITEGQELVNECMIEYKVQIIMRFCLNSQNAEQDDNLPNSLYVSVNNKAISLPTLPSSSHTAVDVKRCGRPLDITHACNISSEALNSVTITWNQPFTNNYCFTVVIYKKLNITDLLDKLKNAEQSPDFTRALIKEKLNTDVDTEISTTSLKISLICPLGKVRLTVPTRSKYCSHLQCFDAATYLQMNEKKPTWICPICDKAAKFESLIVDGLFSEILSLVQDSNEVQFFENGEWKPLTLKKEIYNMPNNNIVCLEVPDSPCSSSSAGTIDLGLCQNSKAKHKENYSGRRLITMVDLTADSDDSDDDDDELLVINGQRSMKSKASRFICDSDGDSN